MGLTQITTGGVDENINIDNNTLKVDGTNNRVGIGTASPTHTLHLSGSSGTQLKVQTSAASAYINLVNSSASGGYVGYQGDNLTLWTGATERFRVDSAGRVGIGNTTMSSFTGNASDNLVVGSGSGGEGITVYSATNNQGSLTFADGTSGDAAYRGAVEYNHTNDRLAFRTAGTGNRMVIDSSGRLLVGTTSASSTATTLLLQGSPDGASGPSYLRIATGTATPGSTSTIGQISFTDSGHSTAASIIAFRDGGSWSSSSKPTKITFSTAANGSSTATERMRIGSDGKVYFGDFTSVGASGYIDKATSGSFELDIVASRSTSTNRDIRFFSRSNSESMRIDTSGRLLIGTTSNARGKLTVFNGDDFSTGTLNDGDNIYLVSDATSGDNVYGASIAFSRVQYADRKAAAIASVQTSSDEDHVGLAFFTHPSSNASDAIVEKMRIEHDGKIGFNTINPPRDYCFHSGQADTNIQITNNTTGVDDSAGSLIQQDGNNLYIWNKENGFFSFGANASEKMRITSDGNVAIGTTAPFGGNVNNRRHFTLNGTDSSMFQWGVNGTERGYLYADATNLSIINTQNGYLRLNTNNTERVRINNLGRVLFGRAITADPWLATGNVDAGQYFGAGNNFGAAFNSREISLILNRTNTTGTIQEFKYNGSTTGWITTSSSGISINYSSDYRLKENVIPLADAVTRVKQLQPKRFNYIIDPDVTVDGFLAHEAQTVVPEAVVGTHNQVDDNGDPIYQGIDPSKLIPLLTAALKEAIAKIETLETKVAALEAAQ